MSNETEAGSTSATAASARLEARRQINQGRKRRRYVIAGAILLLAVSAGIAIGIGGTVVYFRNKKFKAPQPRELTRHIMEDMNKAMRLTPDENEKLEAMIFKGMEQVRQIRRDSFGKMWDSINALNDDIDVVLGPDRAKKWDEAVLEKTGKPRRNRRGFHSEDENDGKADDTRGK